jgi:hypothetical protein
MIWQQPGRWPGCSYFLVYQCLRRNGGEMNSKIENLEITQEALLNEFPQYFRLLAAGLQCGPGWYGIINRAFAGFAMLERSYPDATVTVFRVKQVLGRLEICITSSHPEAAELVRQAMLESAETCEDCGAQGFLHGTTGVAKTLCKKHGMEMQMHPFPERSSIELSLGDISDFPAIEEILGFDNVDSVRADEKPLLIFLDTEFTSLVYGKLISIGLVTESGEEFYVELTEGWEFDYCSDFAKEHVLTLLEGGNRRMNEKTARSSLYDWLSGFGGKVRIVTDAPEFDFKLMLRLLGRPLPPNLHHAPVRLNSVYFPEGLQPYIEDAKNRNAKQGKPKHHALNDAISLREAWTEAEFQSPEIVRRMLEK